MEITNRRDIIGYYDDNLNNLFTLGISIGRRLSKHMHPELEILYVLRGNIQFNIEEELFDVNEGDIILVNFMEVHSIVDALYDCAMFVITAKPSFLEPFKNSVKGKLFMKNVLSAKDVDPTAYDLFSGICKSLYREYCVRGVYYREVIQGLGYSFFTLIPRFIGIKEKPVPSYKADKIKVNITKVYEFIEKNIGKPITLKMTADYIGLSPSRFSHLFKDYMKVSFSKYLADYRILYAKELLLSQPDETILNIAYQSGFSSVQHFARTFKSMYKTSPSRFRKNHLVN